MTDNHVRSEHSAWMDLTPNSAFHPLDSHPTWQPLRDHWQSVEQSLADLPAWSNFWQRLSPKQQQQWQRVCCHSDFVVTAIQRQPDYFLGNNSLIQLVHPEWIEQHIGLDDPQQLLDEDHCMKRLRQVRQRAMVHIIAADICRHSATLDITLALSQLADACIQAAVNIATALVSQRYGEAITASGQHQSLIVLAMGKLGANELNLSSDIDLIFAYEESGTTSVTNSGRREISFQEYFIKIGQKVIQLLDKPTVDGFVFRTDMRLRPYGESGPLVMNFASLQDYYQTQGRDWERFAMIKARLVNQVDNHTSERLQQILQPFTYRAYVDFSAIESLRSMKKLIEAEGRRQGFDNNVKLGSGGIREIEFIVQTFQLIRGGQDPQLQQRSLMPVLQHLVADQQLPIEAGTELWQAYCWLRDSEHAIQAINDKQTQQLPDNELDRLRLASAMDCIDWSNYIERLTHHRQTVRQHFDALIDDRGQQKETSEQSIWWLWWQGQLPDHHTLEPNLHNHSATELASLEQTLDVFRQQSDSKRVQAIGRERLDHLMPMLLKQLWQIEQPNQTLERLLPLLDTILRRSVYLTLLTENPRALATLITLYQASPWVAGYITSTPLLLDELLNPEELTTPPNVDDLRNELQLRLLRIDPDDLEQQMESLRHFSRAHKLRAAACDVLNLQSLMKVSDYLTRLAEACVDAVMRLAWQQMAAKYGYPTDDQGEAVAEPDMLIIGYGKLGGLELGFNSDLDMVFIHNAYQRGETTGGRRIENSVFYTRMGQRMVHLLNTRTPSGDMYEVDLRLRPSGNSGMIVASLSAFQEYQQNHAWTWEHQALVRARAIVGQPDLRQQFEDLRCQILSQPRQQATLGQEVRAMRQKMRDNLGINDSSGQRFHIKQDAGGIVDIEFMVQYGVLAWSQQHPRLLAVTDNMRLLDNFAATGLIDPQDQHTLQDTYLDYRAETHRRALHNQALVIDTHDESNSKIERQRQAIIECWNRWFTD